MSDAPTPEPRAPVTSDTKWIIGTGIGLATLLLVLIGLMFLQNANVNARINDVQANIRDLRADIQADIQDLRADVQANIRDLRTDVQADIRDLRADTRELREIIINAPKGSDPPD